MADETYKQFLARHAEAPIASFASLARYLQSHPDASVTGFIERQSSHYVHSNTIHVVLDYRGFGDPETGEEGPAEVRMQKVVEELRTDMQETAKSLSDDLYTTLEKEYEYQTSDEQVIEALNANDMHFDEKGRGVDMTDFEKVNQLPAAVQQQVIQHYASLFQKHPEEILQALAKSETYFDHHGSRIDITQFKTVEELEPSVMEKVLTRYRDWNVDHEWWEFTYDDYKEKLENIGFEDPDFSFSGFSSQGDGASFTCKSIDVVKYIKSKGAKHEAAKKAIGVVSGLLESNE